MAFSRDALKNALLEEAFGEGSFKASFEKFPETLEKIKEKDPEIAAKIGLVMVEVISVTNKMNSFPDLNIEEKKELSRKVKKIVTQLNEIKKDVERMREKK